MPSERKKNIGGEYDYNGRGKQTTNICHAFYWTGDGEDTFVDAGGDLANTSLYASLIAQIGDVLATFADDYSGIFGANECTKGEGVLTGR